MTHNPIWQPRQRREAALKTLEDDLAESPQDIARLRARADLLAALGETEAAKEAYLKILALVPAHPDVLNNFGALLAETGYKSAAKTVYAQAIAHHAKDPRASVNLGNILYDENDFPGARKCYEDALRCDGALAEAHQGLARICAEERDTAGAARHAERGFRGHAVSVLPYFGAERPVELLMFVAAVGGNIPLKHHIDHKTFRTTALFADFYDVHAPLPAHDVVFNAIGDADFCEDALAAAVRLLEKTAATALNPPAKVSRTGRVENAKRFAALEGVRTAETRLLKKSAVAARDMRFPALLRAPGFHTGQHFVKVDAEKDLAPALKALPGEEVLALEYLDAADEGLHRKYRVMTIGGRLYPLHMAVSKEWKVHYFSAGMTNPRHLEEEKKFLEDMASVLGERGAAALERIARMLDLDYGGIDFGLDAARNILLFEANATMVINPPSAAAPAHCRVAASRAARAVDDLLKGSRS